LRSYLDCISCFMRQALDAARAATSDEDVQRKVLNSVAVMVPELPLDITPPQLAQQIYKLVYQITGNDDPYKDAKEKANQMALALYPQLKEAIRISTDPLHTACKLAIAGNSIDLGAGSDHGDFGSLMELALKTPLAINNYLDFRINVNRSKRILYLGDNAGEIVFDKILIEELRKRGLEINLVVREKPIINDATRHDALSVGLDSVATIVSNGSDAPATILPQCSSEMLSLYHSADIIIAKGQGNYESLSSEQANIFFMLKAKCPVVAEPLGVNVGDALLLWNHS